MQREIQISVEQLQNDFLHADVRRDGVLPSSVFTFILCHNGGTRKQARALVTQFADPRRIGEVNYIHLLAHMRSLARSQSTTSLSSSSSSSSSYSLPNVSHSTHHLPSRLAAMHASPTPPHFGETSRHTHDTNTNYVHDGACAPYGCPIRPHSYTAPDDSAHSFISAHHCPANTHVSLRCIFARIDRHGRGVITLRQLHAALVARRVRILSIWEWEALAEALWGGDGNSNNINSTSRQKEEELRRGVRRSSTSTAIEDSSSAHSSSSHTSLGTCRGAVHPCAMRGLHQDEYAQERASAHEAISIVGDYLMTVREFCLLVAQLQPRQIEQLRRASYWQVAPVCVAEEEEEEAAREKENGADALRLRADGNVPHRAGAAKSSVTRSAHECSSPPPSYNNNNSSRPIRATHTTTIHGSDRSAHASSIGDVNQTGRTGQTMLSSAVLVVNSARDKEKEEGEDWAQAAVRQTERSGHENRPDGTHTQSADGFLGNGRRAAASPTCTQHVDEEEDLLVSPVTPSPSPLTRRKEERKEDQEKHECLVAAHMPNNGQPHQNCVTWAGPPKPLCEAEPHSSGAADMHTSPRVKPVAPSTPSTRPFGVQHDMAIAQSLAGVSSELLARCISADEAHTGLLHCNLLARLVQALCPAMKPCEMRAILRYCADESAAGGACAADTAGVWGDFDCCYVDLIRDVMRWESRQRRATMAAAAVKGQRRRPVSRKPEEVVVACTEEVAVSAESCKQVNRDTEKVEWGACMHQSRVARQPFVHYANNASRGNAVAPSCTSSLFNQSRVVSCDSAHTSRSSSPVASPPHQQQLQQQQQKMQSVLYALRRRFREMDCAASRSSLAHTPSLSSASSSAAHLAQIAAARERFFAQHDDTHSGYMTVEMLMGTIQAWSVRQGGRRRPVESSLLRRCVEVAQLPLRWAERRSRNSVAWAAHATQRDACRGDVEQTACERAVRVPAPLRKLLCDYRYLLEKIR